MRIEELADRYAEMCESTDDCDFCKYNSHEDCRLYFGYTQGIAEAIDIVEDLKSWYESLTHEEYYVSAMVSDLEDLLEQLKEQRK